MNAATRRYGQAVLACLVPIVLTGCGKPDPAEQLQKARVALTKSDAPNAIVHLKAALQTRPSLAEARFLLGTALLQSGNATGGAVELEKAAELGHSPDAVSPALAQAWLALGQAKKVVDRFGNVRLESPAQFAALKAALAAARAALGQIKDSDADVATALELDPKNVDARLLQVRATLRMRQLDPALAQLEALLADAPREVRAMHLKGQLLWLGKRDAAAGAAAMASLLEVDPKFLPAHQSLMSMALQAKDTAAFQRRVETLQKALPNHPETRMAEVQAAILREDFKSARDGSQQLLKIAPDNPRVLFLAGTAELRGGSVIGAINQLSKAVQLSPASPPIRNALAQAYLRSGEPARALATVQPLLDQPWQSADTLSIAGEAALQNGQFDAASKLYQRAAKLAPDQSSLRTALAVTQIAQGQTQAGIAELEAIAAGESSTHADLALISARIRNNELDLALKAVDRLATKAPKSPLPAFLAGRIKQQRKDLAGARQSYEKALALEPSYYPAVAGLAALDVADKKLDSAVTRIEDALKKQPGLHAALLSLVDLKLAAGAPPEAIRRLLDDAIQANPKDPRPRLTLVDLLLARKDKAAAVNAAQQAASAFPENMAVQDALGRAQLAAGEHQQALSAFGKVATAQPQSMVAQLRVADAYMYANDSAAATRVLRRALEIDPRAIEPQRALLLLAVNEKRWSDALQIARQVQKQRATESVGFLLEGQVLSAQRQWPLALEAIQAAAKRDPSTPVAIQLHAAMRMANKATAAAEFADARLKQRPKDVAFVAHLGSVAMEDKDFATAERMYRSVLELQPRNVGVMNNLAWVLTQQGKSGAIELAEQAHKLAPSEPAIMDTLAGALARAGRTAEAIGWLERAIANAAEPTAHGYRLSLARLQLKAGNHAAARVQLEKLAYLGDKFPLQAEVAKLMKSSQ